MVVILFTLIVPLKQIEVSPIHSAGHSMNY